MRDRMEVLRVLALAAGDCKEGLYGLILGGAEEGDQVDREQHGLQHSTGSDTRCDRHASREGMQGCSNLGSTLRPCPTAAHAMSGDAPGRHS